MGAKCSLPERRRGPQYPQLPAGTSKFAADIPLSQSVKTDRALNEDDVHRMT
jgi:hypothetical protein